MKIKNPDRFIKLWLIFEKVYRILPTRVLVRIFWVSYLKSHDKNIKVKVMAMTTMDKIKLVLMDRRKEHLLW